MTAAQTSPPVFVFGALRSGTTLLRLMLNSHDRITNPGETDFLFDFLTPDASHPTGWRYDIQAMQAHRIFKAHRLNVPAGRDGLDLLHDLIAQLGAGQGGVLTLNVHRHADRIIKVLPDARFIHLIRDPRDVARSSIGMGWSGTSFWGINHWIGTERAWDAAGVPAAQVLDLKFEDLMGDITHELGRLCAFLGVPFSNRMLRYHENTSYGPPDPAIARQWRTRASPREIALLEGKCGDLITARGYELNGQPAVPGRAELAALYLRDRLLRWRFNIRRFGLPVFLLSQITRHIHIGPLNELVRRKKDKKSIEVLK